MKNSTSDGENQRYSCNKLSAFNCLTNTYTFQQCSFYKKQRKVGNTKRWKTQPHCSNLTERTKQQHKRIQMLRVCGDAGRTCGFNAERPAYLENNLRRDLKHFCPPLCSFLPFPFPFTFPPLPFSHPAGFRCSITAYRGLPSRNQRRW